MKEIAFFTGDVSFFKKVREGWKMPELLADATDLSRTFLGETVEPLTIVARPEVNLHASEFAAFLAGTSAEVIVSFSIEMLNEVRLAVKRGELACKVFFFIGAGADADAEWPLLGWKVASIDKRGMLDTWPENFENEDRQLMKLLDIC